MPAASSFRAMMSPGLSAITDTFTDANGAALGTTDTGHSWEIISGTWSIQSNRAYTSTSPGSNPIAVVDLGTPNAAAMSINLGFMDMAVLRFLDTSNYLRLVRGHTTGSYDSYCTYTNYSASGDYISCDTCGWSCSPSGCGCNNTSCSIYGGNYCTHPSTACNTNFVACDCRCSADGTCQVSCGTQYYDIYYWALQQVIGGTVTTLHTAQPGSNISGLSFTAIGNTITATDGSNSSGAKTIPAALAGATKFGIGRTSYQSTNSQSIDNFNLTPQ